MNSTQQKLYEILTKFDSLCKKYGIVYYLGGGSALGALRHRGFLPWDDDVDLYITRKNYQKLLEVENQFFGDDFKLVNSTNYPKYGNSLVRCVDTNSTAITKARIADDTPRGQFIELFILDPMPKDEIEQEKWKTKHWIYTEILSIAFKVANYRIDKYVDRHLYDKYVEQCELKGREVVLKELEEELFNIDESEADEYCSRWGIRNLVYDIKWFQEPRYVKFEDTELPVATYAENVLRFDYGDNWMYIPEVDNQISHSFADSMTIGYQYLVEDYSYFVNTERIYNSYKKRKRNLMNLQFAKVDAHKMRQELKCVQVFAYFDYYGKTVEDFKQMLDNKQYDEIEDYFRPWYDNQFHYSFWSWETLIKIDDDKLYVALLVLLLRGEYSRVRKLLLWRIKEGILSKELEGMYNFVELIRNIYIAIDNREENQICKYLDDIAVLDFPYKEEQLDYLKLRLQCEIKDLNAASNVKKIADIKNDCQKLLDKYPGNGELMSMMGDIFYNIKDMESAIRYYVEARENTRHGFVIMHINDIFAELGKE